MKILTQNIKQLYIDERISKKGNVPYSVLVLEMKSGYKYESFLNNDQLYILGSLAQSAGN